MAHLFVITEVLFGPLIEYHLQYLRTDFATNINTVLKMAKKRSYVDAILTACHASGVFTQDIEDISSSLAPSTSTCTAKEA